MATPRPYGVDLHHRHLPEPCQAAAFVLTDCQTVSVQPLAGISALTDGQITNVTAPRCPEPECHTLAIGHRADRSTGAGVGIRFHDTPHPCR